MIRNEVRKASLLSRRVSEKVRRQAQGTRSRRFHPGAQGSRPTALFRNVGEKQMMKKFFAPAILALMLFQISFSGFVRSTGSITAGHVATFVSPNLIQDGGAGGTTFNNHSLFVTGTPTISACGGAGSSIAGVDNAFAVAAGSTAGTTCGISFGTSFTTAPVCVAIQNAALTAGTMQTSSTISSVTITWTNSVASVSLRVICF